MNVEFRRPAGRLLGGLGLCLAMLDAAQAEATSLRYVGTAAVVATTMQLPVQATPVTFYLGAYNIQEQGGASFLAYCSDPAQFSSSDYQSYDKVALADHLAATPTLRQDVERLFGHAYQSTLGNTAKAAGFSMALWEIWRDDRNLDTGIVQAIAATDAAARAEAQSLLDSLPTWTTAGTVYRLTVYANYTDATHYQDYISASPVPEPSNYALMLAGLGSLAAAIGRRRAR